MQHLRLIFALFLMWCLGTIAIAQDNSIPSLDTIYQAPDGSLQVAYPSAWEVELPTDTSSSQWTVGFGNNLQSLLIATYGHTVPMVEGDLGFAVTMSRSLNPAQTVQDFASRQVEHLREMYTNVRPPQSLPINGKAGQRILAVKSGAGLVQDIIHSPEANRFVTIAVVAPPQAINHAVELMATIHPTLVIATSQSAGGTLVTSNNSTFTQWASSADGTSQYGTDSWSFQQATGEPNTESCGDISTAWASSSSTGQDTLTLYYDTPVKPSQIDIYQTYNPGSIIRVEVVTLQGEVITLPNSADPLDNTPCPGVFSLTINDNLPPVNAINIHVDQTIGGSWNEIDAVSLTGQAVDGVVATEPEIVATEIFVQLPPPEATASPANNIPPSSENTTNSARIATTFDNGVTGWEIIGDIAPEQFLEAGDGFICSPDTTSGTRYYQSPESWNAVLASAYGTTIIMDIRQDRLTTQHIDTDIRIVTEERQLLFNLPTSPHTAFTHYEIPLTAEVGWQFSDNQPVTESSIREHLLAVTALQIRAEYGTGDDESCLSYVAIGDFGRNTIFFDLRDADQRNTNYTFDTSTDAWLARQNGMQPEHNIAGNDGFICLEDDTGGTAFYAAPQLWAGDLSDWYGKTLVYDIRQSATTGQYDDVEIEMKSFTDRLTIELPHHPHTLFTHYEIPLTAEAGWVFANGEPATEARMRELFRFVTEFHLRGEYVSGSDSSCLSRIAVEDFSRDDIFIDLRDAPTRPDTYAFKNGVDEWTAIGNTSQPEHTIEAGDGMICSSDDSGGTMRYNAPAIWGGDYSDYHGGTLVMELRQDSTESQYDDVELELISFNDRIRFEFAQHPDVIFTHYEIPLTGSAGWQGISGEPIEEATMQQFMTFITGLTIRGEYRSGSDSSCLTLVAIRPAGVSVADVDRNTEASIPQVVETEIFVQVPPPDDATVAPLEPTPTEAPDVVVAVAIGDIPAATPAPDQLDENGVLRLSPLPNPQDFGFAAVFTDEPDIGAMAISPYGEALGVAVQRDFAGNITHITGTTHILPSGDTMTVQLNNQGLPEVAIVNETTYVFANYNGNLVDVAILTPDGNTEFLLDVPLNPEVVARIQALNILGQASLVQDQVVSRTLDFHYQPSVEAVNQRSLTYLANVGSLGVTLVGCALSLGPASASGVGLAIWVAACASGVTSGGAAVSESHIRLWNSVHDAGRNSDEANFNAAATAVNIASTLAAEFADGPTNATVYGPLSLVLGSMGEISRRNAVKLEQQQIDINAANDRLLQRLRDARATQEGEGVTETQAINLTGIPIQLNLGDACATVTIPGTMNLSISAETIAVSFSGEGSGTTTISCDLQDIPHSWNISYNADLSAPFPTSDEIQSSIDIALSGPASVTIAVDVSDCGFGAPCSASDTVSVPVNVSGSFDLALQAGSGTISGNSSGTTLQATWVYP